MPKTIHCPRCDAEVTTPFVVLALDEVAKRHVLATIDYAKGNKSQAARLLGIDRRTLYRSLARWGVESAPRKV